MSSLLNISTEASGTTNRKNDPNATLESTSSTPKPIGENKDNITATYSPKNGGERTSDMASYSLIVMFIFV
jgi:hypothetical protein